MNLPHWLNPDGSLKTGVAYWVYENYAQWLRGDHNAHIQARFNLLSLESFCRFKAFKAEQRNHIHANELDRQKILSVLPEHMRVALPVPVVPINAKPRSYIMQLRRGIPND